MVSSSSAEYLPDHPLRPGARQASVHRGADRVDVAPGAELLALAVVFGRGEARGVHRRQLQAIHGERLARGAEVDEHRVTVVAHVDVARLDVQVQQLVGVHLAQAVQQVRERAADPLLLDRAGLLVDVFLQRAAALVAHHEVHRLVGAEEIDHAHHVRMLQARERAAFLEEAFQAVAERREVFLRHHRRGMVGGAQRERRRQVFLDRHRRFLFVVREVHEREAARGDHPQHPVVLELKAFGQRLVGLRGHSPI